MPDVLVIREQIVESLSRSLRRGRDGLDVIPGLLRRAIKDEAWKERKDYRLTGEIIPAFPSFRAFVEAKPPAGLGTNTDFIERIIRDDDETLLMFRRATVGKKGRPPKENNNNVIIKNGLQGNSRAYVLERLKRCRADLFEQVKAKKLSANAAAIEAGFRKKRTPLEQIQRMWWKLSDDDTAEFREWLKWADQ